MNNEQDKKSPESENCFLRTEQLTMHFPIGKKTVHAADDISISVPKGKTLGVVGESGCGKSTLGKMIVGLYKPTHGKIYFEGTELTALSVRDRAPYAKKIQLVWQDAYSSLDPRMRGGEIVEEGMENFCPELNKLQRREKMLKLLDMCGLYEEHAEFFPHQFSGGQRQRLAIARALSTDPELIVCDEAVSALDVSVQAQIINLLKDLQDELHLTYIFISHDLNVVRYVSDEIIVMYLGEIVERGSKEAVYNNMAHPYTKLLFSATPVFAPGEKRTRRIPLRGDVASSIDPPKGCRFAGRCPDAGEKCREEAKWHEVEKNHYVKCHMFDE